MLTGPVQLQVGLGKVEETRVDHPRLLLRHRREDQVDVWKICRIVEIVVLVYWLARRLRLTRMRTSLNLDPLPEGWAICVLVPVQLEPGSACLLMNAG